jgi:hypothetical protein
MTDSRFPEPEPDDWEPPSLKELYTPRPLDTKPYQSELNPLDIPPYVIPTDHTAPIGGWDPGTGAGHRDELTELTLQQEVDLLAKNNVYLSSRQLNPQYDSGLGAMAAYVVSNTLRPAGIPVVRFKKLTLQTTQEQRHHSITYSHNEFESHLKRQLASESKISFGIPKIFKVETSYGYASASAVNDHTVSVHFAATQIIPKARLVFDAKDITLADSFVEQVKDICKSTKPWLGKAEELLSHLEKYGHFVPMDRYLGGRISLLQVTQLSDSSTFESVRHTFGLAADARFKVRSVPGEVGGGTDLGIWNTKDEAVIAQAKTLDMELKGGNEDLASSNPTILGNKWINSLGSYKGWRTIGFEELVPIIDFLPGDLRKECENLLRQYFVRNLVHADTRKVGHVSPENQFFADKNIKYDDGRPLDRDLTKSARRVSKIVVNSEGNVDALTLSYEIYYGAGNGWSWPTTTVSGTYGRPRANFERKAIEFRPGEEISALELWVDPTADDGVIRSLAIQTNMARYPDAEGFYGSNPKPGQKNPKPGVYLFEKIEAPRVRVLRGYSGAYVHCLWLSYLKFASPRFHEYLLTMEPFLFPFGNYGPF